jgi:arylsulfatase A-like enzyme
VPNGKPNILVIWGDDIGITNLSCYSDGMMGYRTPNIDRIASEGMRFTDSYGEQSCTAGRAAFISGQSVYRTGMSKVGVPGVDIGWAAEDPTIAELLKPLGYATGQFGKNHFGDLNKYLPTVHGFDEFYGNLYHLNAEEEPEQFDYPHKDQFPRLYELALPRGVMDCKALDEVSTEPDDPKFGPVGKQTITDTGPLTAKRMETIDDGPHRNTWPDAGTTPFRSEKNTNWEGAYRVPEMIRWPGKIKAGSVSNDIIQHHDWLPTLLAAAGDPDVSDELKKGHKAGADGETEYKVHIDGFNLLPYLMGEVEHSPRRGFFYFNDDAELVAMRFENWKIVFAEQRCRGTLQIWAEPFTELRVPKLFNLRTDPFEYADVTSNTYYEWFLRRDFFVFYATAMASAFLDTFKEFPPRHPPASFSIDQIVKKLDAFLAAD